MPIVNVLARAEKFEAVPVQMTCDRCGHRKTAEEFSRSTNFLDGFQQFSLYGSFGSRVPPDCTEWDVVVCESCLDEWFNSFATPPWHSKLEALHTEREVSLFLHAYGSPWTSANLADLRPEPPSLSKEQQKMLYVKHEEFDATDYFGVFRHFKGGLYRASGVVFDLSNDFEPLVVYETLSSAASWRSLCDGAAKPGIFLRPASMWFEEVERSSSLPDGSSLFTRGPRFERVEE